MRRSRLAILATFVLLCVGRPASAQVSFDPPTSINPPPNVMLMMDATRTNLINGSTCRGLCHAEHECSGEHDCNILRDGETRLQLARRALTGGYGWNTNRVGPDGPADALVRTDGVMDRYKVRWGVAFYDGVGTRLAIDPTDDNEAAQRAVIDFGQTPNDTWGAGGNPQLNSFIIYARTIRCCGNGPAAGAWDPNQEWLLPWWDEMADSQSRMGRSLRWMEDYWRPGVAAAQFAPGPASINYPAWFSPGADPTDEDVIDGDVANVLVSPGAAGCRRNFTILLSDENGANPYNGDSIADIASRIHNLPGPAGLLPEDKAAKVFHIHFGVGTPQTGVADSGWDGLNNTIPPAPFIAAPGGTLTLPPLLASFGAVFSIILSGSYNGAPATVNRLGDRVARSYFSILNCLANPVLCNLGRPAELEWATLAADGSISGVEWNAANILRVRPHTDRALYTGAYATHASTPTETNCGPGATCATPTAQVLPLNDLNLSPMYGGPEGVNADVVSFVRGDPYATFVNGSLRGDVDGNMTVDDPYKLMDTLNSRPVIVGAPPGIGEQQEQWTAFRNSLIQRAASPAGGTNALMTVARRDQVLYIGANDGFLHSFLVGQANATPDEGAGATYSPFAATCASAAPPTAEIGPSAAECNGKELWAYSPRLLQPAWQDLRAGHVFMVDGTPVIEDVLFTKGRATPGTPCSYSTFGPLATCDANSWEYRTVLIQCLAGGGPGCFALDVTNPWVPSLLWERAFTGVIGKSTSTSLPLVARVKRVVPNAAGGTVAIPYSVALMGGGFKELDANNVPKGTFIAVGIEDGQVFTSPVSADADFASGPTCFDADNDTYTDTCYILTRDASIYKIRMEGGDPAQMTMVKFFDGTDNTASGDTDIRAFTKLIATPTTDNKIALFFATGDVEHVPLSTEQNFLFKVRDLDPLAMVPWDATIGGVFANTARQEGACVGGPPDPLTGLDPVRPGTFRIPLGEKVLFNPVLLAGAVLFTSYKPELNPCLVGQGYLYGVRHDTCGPGLDTNADPNRQPDDTRVELDTGIPSGVAASYTTGNIVVTNSDTNIIDTRTSRPPAPAQSRLYKLRWRRGA